MYNIITQEAWEEFTGWRQSFSQKIVYKENRCHYCIALSTDAL